MTENEIIIKYGKKDGHDEHRLSHAKKLGGELDMPVWMVFERLIILEEKGLVELIKEPVK